MNTRKEQFKATVIVTEKNRKLTQKVRKFNLIIKKLLLALSNTVGQALK